MNKILKEYYLKGGLRYGRNYFDAWNITWPGVVLVLSSKELCFKINSFLTKKTFCIAQEDIIKIEKTRGIFSRGFRIIHKNNSLPPFMIFWHFRIKKVEKILRSLNYM